MQTQVVAEVATLAAADIAACDRAALAELVTRSQRVRSWLDAFDATVAAAAARLAAEGRCEPPGTLLTGGGRRSGRDAQAAAARGNVCQLLPGVHQALAHGTLTGGHADALARLAGDLDDAGRARLRELEPNLVAAAAATSVEAFCRDVAELGRHLSGDEGVSRQERLRRQRSLPRWVDRHSGLCHTHLTLDPETDAKVSAALDGAVAAEQATAPPDDQRSFDQLRADAMVNLITGARQPGHRPPEIIVVIDWTTLAHGLHGATVCETGDGQPLPPAVVRRLACDAEIIPVVLGGDGVALDVGRSRRTATWAQRRALRAMHRTCIFPGCTVRFADCEIHHVTPWEHGGTTDLCRLAPACSVHHHLVHEGGWTLTLHPDRTATWTRPDGTVHHHGPTIDTTPSGLTDLVDFDDGRSDATAAGGDGPSGDELMDELAAMVDAALKRRTGPPARDGPDPGS